MDSKHTKDLEAVNHPLVVDAVASFHRSVI